MLPNGCQQRLSALLGPRGYLDRPEDLTLYEYDGGVDKHRPDLVVFPRTTEEVSAIVKIAQEFHVPFVGRGAGTGLSGGAIPAEGGIMIAFARMNRILEIDLENERAVVQPGVVNLDITLAVQNSGYFYAPDPSSQRACTIGGNVAENAGGPHTLAYGVTTNHVLGLELVLPDGTVVETGGKEPDLPGYDLTGLLTGSEGTMVLVTKGHRAAHAQARDGEDRARHLRVQRRCRPHRGRDHRARHHPRRGGDARRRDAPHGGGSHPCRLPDGRRRRAADRARRHARGGGRAGRADSRGLRGLRAPASSASPAPPRSATCSGRAARTPSAPWAASAPPTTCRTASCRAPRSPPRSASSARSRPRVRPHHQQHLPCRRRQHAPHHSVQRAQARRPGKGARRRRGDPDLLHRRRRLHHRRARRGHGEERADGAAVSPRDPGDDRAASSCCSIPTTASTPGKSCPPAAAAWRSANPRSPPVRRFTDARRASRHARAASLLTAKARLL